MPQIVVIDEGEELPEPAALEKQKEWMRKVKTMLLGFKTYKPDKRMVDMFLAENVDFELCNLYGYELVLDVILYFQAGITQPNRAYCKDYMKILEKIYMMLTERNKLVFHKRFIVEWQQYPVDYTPYFEVLIPDHDIRISEMMNEISQTSANITSNIIDKLRFLIMVTPNSTLLKMFTHVTRNPSVLPFTVALCHTIPDLFHDRHLSMWHNEYESDQVEPLLALVFRRLICSRRCALTTTQEYDALEVLAIALTNYKKGVPIMSCWVLLNLVFCEIYSVEKAPITSHEMLTGLASRILSPRNEAVFDWKFATSLRTQPASRVYLTPTIIDMTLNLMVKNHASMESFEVTDNCKNILQGIGNRMREEDAEFDYETKMDLVEKLRELPWWVEYAMSTWFWALNIRKRRVPSAIFRAICSEEELEELDNAKAESVDDEETESDTQGSECSQNSLDCTQDSKSEDSEYNRSVDSNPEPVDTKVQRFVKITDMFEEIKASETPEDSVLSCSERYLLAIIEIGLFDVECALELLHTKTNISFVDDEELKKQMSNALNKCYGIKIGLHGFEDARIMFIDILGIFAQTIPVEEHEEVVRGMLENVRLPSLKVGKLLLMKKFKQSLIIQSLEPPLKEKIIWPPAESNFLRIAANALRNEQKKEREHLLKVALAKCKELAQYHRETWADRRVNTWVSSESPTNEFEVSVSSSDASSPSRSSDQSNLYPSPPQEYQNSEEVVDEEDEDEIPQALEDSMARFPGLFISGLEYGGNSTMDSGEL